MTMMTVILGYPHAKGYPNGTVIIVTEKCGCYWFCLHLGRSGGERLLYFVMAIFVSL